MAVNPLYSLAFSRNPYLIIAGYDEQDFVSVFVSHVVHRVQYLGGVGHPVAILRSLVFSVQFIASSNVDPNNGYNVRINLE